MKHINTKTLITVLIFGILSSLAGAKNVEKLMAVMEVDKQMVGGFEAMLPIADQLSAQLSLNEKEKEELLGIYRNWFNHDIDRAKLSREIAELYRQTFSEKEIQDLLDFYSSPTGQKLVQEFPVLAQKQAQLGMAEAESKQKLLLEKLSPFIEKHSPKSSAYEGGRRTSQEKTILNNLRMLASAADQYFLENGVNDVEIDQLIGPGKYIKELKPVDGEDYSELDLSMDANEWTIVSEGGITVNFSR